jgi:hypothetical protein
MLLANGRKVVRELAVGLRQQAPRGGRGGQSKTWPRHKAHMAAPTSSPGWHRVAPMKASRPLIRVLVINDNDYGLTFLFKL